LSFYYFHFVAQRNQRNISFSFTDRNNNPFSISNPTAFLSQKAIDRSLKGVPIQINDLPVNPDYVDSVISKGSNRFYKSKWFNGVTVQADSATREQIMTLPFVRK